MTLLTVVFQASFFDNSLGLGIFFGRITPRRDGESPARG